MRRPFFLIRFTSVVAAIGAAVGALLMFVVGATSVYDAVDTFVSNGGDKTGHSGVDATAFLVTALDEFLFGLVLLFFAYGVFALFVVPDPDTWHERAAAAGTPAWMQVSGLGELKTKLLEVVVVLFAVSFLKVALEEPSSLSWSLALLPVAMVATAIVIWMLRRAE